MISIKNEVKTLVSVVLITGALFTSSCSTLKTQEKDIVSVKGGVDNRATVTVVDTEIQEEKLDGDTSEMAGVIYSDNSIPDSVWANDYQLLKNLDVDDYIRSVDSTWMDQMYASGLYNDNKTSEYSEVIRVDDSIIKMRLAELNSISPIDFDYNPVVKTYINTYLYRRSKQMERMMGLAEYYYPMFEETLDKYDIPLELKNLAIVESALNPRAKSRVGASGLWQFMYGTGKAYDLKVSSYVDERYDPQRATEAAARYMRDLYKMFGDWNLVLAAYNSGPGNVKKAIRRSGGHKNYWYIRPYLPRETRGYVPAFIAANYAMHFGPAHNLRAVHPKMSYYRTDTVIVKEVLTFDFVSKEMNISVAELEFLNPSYKHNIIPKVKGRNYVLVLPIDIMDAFVSKEDSIYAMAARLNEADRQKMPKYYEANDMIRYRVRSGDNLGYIAKKYGVGVSEIKRWNKLRSNNIRVGQRLTIYPRKFGSASRRSASKSSSNVKKSKLNGAYEIYTVRAGDNLWQIAKRFPGVSAQNIQAWNGINNHRTLKPGMKLKIAKRS